MSYSAPVDEFRFLLQGVLPETGLGAHWSFETMDEVLSQAAEFAETVLAPLNASGDRHGVVFDNGQVRVLPEFHAAYQRFCAQGWPGLRTQSQYGGMDAPQCLAAVIEEIWCGANLAFRLAPMLSRSAIEAMSLHGDALQQQIILPKLVSGQWLGTMNLTEPQAGSDVGAVRTKAIAAGDHYRLIGQKCFITYGEHSLTENIVHLILAREAGAPSGTKGLSLFAVPKFLIDSAGRLGERNDVRCLRVENKMGIHASPTCVMSYGESPGSAGAMAYRVGQAGQGMEIMFIMMNHARLAVGIEGQGLAERALTMAMAYAATRVQGRVPANADSPAIESHPDVRRMLWEMRARVQAARALSVYTAAQWDAGMRSDAAAARTALLIPLVKSLGTETAQHVTSLSLQVHGGMGYIEDTGVAQLYRDARIGAIYEGTNGIQALDFLQRKVAKDAAVTLNLLCDQMQQEITQLGHIDWLVADLPRLTQAIEQLRQTTRLQLQRLSSQPAVAHAMAVPFASQAAITIAAWCLCRQARFSVAMSPEFWIQKRQAIQTYLCHILPETLTLATRIHTGGFGYNDP